jgi:DNA invertase Pin-like site-specific DNA recombinase
MRGVQAPRLVCRLGDPVPQRDGVAHVFLSVSCRRCGPPSPLAPRTPSRRPGAGPTGRRVEAAGYLRTSSTTNVGDGKDSEARQRKAIESYAKAAGIVIVDWFYDAAVSGADPIEARPGFAALLARIAGSGVRTIIVETANRFARDLMVQEVGFAMLRDLGVTLIAADSPSSFLDDGPTSKLIRQILGAVSEFDKAMIVAKLKGARDRARRARGKCEGRKAYAEQEGGQELVAAARQLRTNPSGRPHSLRQVAAHLAERGYVTPSGRPYSASAIASMLGEK